MTDPIPVSDAIRACERLIAICDAPADRFAHCANCGISFPVEDDFDVSQECDNWDSIGSPCGGSFTITTVPTMEFSEDGEAFVNAARATLKPLAEYLKGRAEATSEYTGKISDNIEYYAPIAAIVAHLDQTEPDWRTK